MFAASTDNDRSGKHHKKCYMTDDLMNMFRSNGKKMSQKEVKEFYIRTV